MTERPPDVVPMAAGSDGDGGTARRRARMASRVFASTVSMLILIPGLMLLAGAALVSVGQTGLRLTIEESLRQRVTDITTGTARSTAGLFEQAPPLLAALREQVVARRVSEPRAFAAEARLLMRARPGLRYISFSGADGSFMGIYTDTPGSDVLRLNHSWIEADGTTTRRISDMAPDGTLTTVETVKDTGYDPRKRPFYAPAAAATGPAWTPPYDFFQSERGITCALAVRDPADGALLGVATVDFDFTSLALVMKRLAADGPKGGVVFLFTGEQELLATSADPTDATQNAIRAKAVELTARIMPPEDQMLFLDLGPENHHVLIGVRSIRIPGGPVWYAGTRVPRGVISERAEAQFSTTLWIGLAGLAIAVVLALALARYLAQQRRIVSDARTAERSAKERLRAMGSYTLIRELGQGGMGAVWMAQHQLLARPAALKLILPEALGRSEAERDEARRRFEREAKATASLRSRNTVTLYDYGLAANGSFFYAMELLDGLDLDRLVTDHGPQRPGRVVQILIQACQSLAEAHARGMVHRDIKPANIQLCRLGLEVDVVKVLDFGLVTIRASKGAQLTQAGLVTGTPAFMAPEQAQARPVDGRTDLYALGCVAYWLLAGRAVFEQEDMMAVMIEHIRTPPQALSSAARQPIAPALERLVMQLLAKDPAERPADAMAMIAALRAIVLPPEQAWSPADADAWWKRHKPPADHGTGKEAKPAAGRQELETVIRA